MKKPDDLARAERRHLNRVVVGLKLALVSALILVLVSFVLGMKYAQGGLGRCPSEDSCQVDWNGHGWVVKEVTP